MDKVYKILNFFRLLDENRLLSITNIAVVIVLVKVAITPNPDVEALAALVAAIGAYNFKRWASLKAPPKLPEQKVKELEDKINSIAVAAGFRKSR